MVPTSSANLIRPVVFDYRSSADFFRDMMFYQKKRNPKFSIRKKLKDHKCCSPALVSQVLKQKRRLTRDQLPIFGSVFSLNATELEFIDQQLISERSPNVRKSAKGLSGEKKIRIAKNHLLNDWLNVYVKDTCQLKGFRPEASTIHALLNGIASVNRISRSLAFLIREGFWRYNSRGQIVPEDPAVFTSDGPAHGKIRQFHKQALKLALRGLDIFPVERRRASTILLSVNKDSAEELRSLVHKFQNELFDFMEKHSNGNESLYQVIIHLTPIGSGKC